MTTKEEAYSELTSRLGTLWAVIVKASADWRRDPTAQREALRNVQFSLKQTIGTLTTLFKDKTLNEPKVKARLDDTIDGLKAALVAVDSASFANPLELRASFQQSLTKILKQVLRETPAKAPAANLLEKVAA